MNNDTSKSPRISNGYRLIYLPDHPSAMKNANWDGYVYEHIVVAEESIGRRLKPEEVVHHLNGDRLFNLRHNLLVLERGQHSKLHIWINSGAPGCESLRLNGENSEESKFVADYSKELKYCENCQLILQDKQRSFCGDKCSKLSRRKVTRPSKEKLMEEVSNNSMAALGKKYGVSDNAIRKWLKTYAIDKTTLSRALDTSKEGAETSGEVKTS